MLFCYLDVQLDTWYEYVVTGRYVDGVDTSESPKAVRLDLSDKLDTLAKTDKLDPLDSVGYVG